MLRSASAARQFSFLGVFLGLAVALAGWTGAALGVGPSTVVPVFGEHGFSTGFLCDSSGLILTDLKTVAGSLAPRVGISRNQFAVGRPIAANGDRGVAVLWVSPDLLSNGKIPPFPLQTELESPLAPGDSVRAVCATLPGGVEIVAGTVYRVHEHRLELALPMSRGRAGAPVLDRHNHVVAILRSGDLDPSVIAIATPVADLIPLVAASAESTQFSPSRRSKVIPGVAAETLGTSALQGLERRPHRDIRDFQIQADGYLISLLTPLMAFELERSDSTAGRWFLWGAYGDDYPCVVGIHVQFKKRSPMFLWPLGAVASLGRGTAHAVGSIVGAVADGVTGGGASQDPVLPPNRDRCSVDLVRDGVVTEPLLCQCSGHAFDTEHGVFVPGKGPKAAFFYYSRQTFESRGERAPDLVLDVSDPSHPDVPDRIQLPHKLIEMVAADFASFRRTGTNRPETENRPGTPKLLMVRLKDGSVHQGVDVEAWGPREVRIVLSAGERIFVPRNEIQSVMDDVGNDLTTRLLPPLGKE